MATKPKKGFSTEVAKQLETATSIPLALPSLEEVLGNVQDTAEDYLSDLLDATSDRTVKAQPLAEPNIVSTPDAIQDKALPESLGEETGVSPDYIAAVEKFRAAGKSLSEAEQLAQRNTPPPQQPMTAPMGTQQGGGWGTDPTAGDATAGGIYQAPEEARPFTAQDVAANEIAATEMIDWYDVLQSVGSVWAYEHFSSPKNASDVVEKLTPKVLAGTATSSEKEVYSAALRAQTDFTRRKTSFSESVAMSKSLKDRTARLLTQIMELREVRMSPEVLLGFLLLTPLVVNGGRIALEKLGFGNADEMVGMFSQFVDKQEAKHWQQDQP